MSKQAARSDFQMELNTRTNLTYFTPQTIEAQDWSAKHLHRNAKHGKSYFFAAGPDGKHNAARDFKGYLKREGFTVTSQ